MNKATLSEPNIEVPVEVQAEIRAHFAAMDRIDERIAKDFQEIDRLKIKTSATLAQIKGLLAELGAK